ncbi:MAG: hypothetical protein Kow00124_22590 [Anaerolineae bacterium]
MLALAVVLMAAAACTGQSVEEPAVPTSTPAPTATPRPQPRPAAAGETPTPPLLSESALDEIRSRGELRAGVLYNYPPFSYLADNGELKGFEVDLIRRIGEQWGVEVTFVQVTRQTRMPMLMDGEVDLIAGAFPRRRELEQFVEYSDPTFRGGVSILAKGDSGITGLADLAGVPVGVVGADVEAPLREAAGQQGVTLTLTPYDDLDSALRDLMGDAEAGIAPSLTALVGHRETMILAATTSGELELVGDPVVAETYAMAVRQGDTPLRDMLNLAMQQIAAAGSMGELFSANFYGYPADIFPTYPGQPAFTFENFPADLSGSTVVMDRLRRGEPLRVAGLALDEEPALFDSQPIIDGYNRAVINEMARRWNVPVTEIPTSTGAAGLDLLRSGQADLVVGITRETSLIGTVAFSEPYYQVGLRMVHQDDVALFGINDLDFKPSLAAPPIDLSEALIRDNNLFPSVRTADTFEDAYRRLKLYTVWAIVGDEYSLVLMSQADEDIVLFEQRFRPRNRVMGLPPHDSDFQALVNFTLQDMQADGTIDRLREQYFGPYMAKGEELEPFTAMDYWPGDGSYLGMGESE